MLYNPIETISHCSAHAQYVALSNLKYRNRSGEEVLRRPEYSEIEIASVFPQIWGNTSCGHGGLAGNAITEAYRLPSADRS